MGVGMSTYMYTMEEEAESSCENRNALGKALEMCAHREKQEKKGKMARGKKTEKQHAISERSASEPL